MAIALPLHWLPAEEASKTLELAKVEQARNWRAEFDRFLERVEFGEVPWTKDLREGEPQTEILAAARAHQANVIVMGTTGRSGVRRLLIGGVTRHVLRQLPCAMFVVKDQQTTASANE
jgi:nucleotide-binding universal stress UspA family protein